MGKCRLVRDSILWRHGLRRLGWTRLIRRGEQADPAMKRQLVRADLACSMELRRRGRRRAGLGGRRGRGRDSGSFLPSAASFDARGRDVEPGFICFAREGASSDGNERTGFRRAAKHPLERIEALDPAVVRDLGTMIVDHDLIVRDPAAIKRDYGAIISARFTE
jgi:hypothetical protein